MVLLLGRSLLLAGVAASLGGCDGARVTRAATWLEAMAQLAEQTPDVIIFDLANANESHLLPLVLQNPRLVLVGLDAERNQAVLVSGQSAQALTMAQLREIVERRDVGRTEPHEP